MTAQRREDPLVGRAPRRCKQPIRARNALALPALDIATASSSTPFDRLSCLVRAQSQAREMAWLAVEC